MVLAAKHKRPSTSIRHKKRYGQHRKQTKHYMETYWPYLPIALIVILGLSINYLWSSNRLNFESTTNINPSSLLLETNHERAASFQEPLQFNQQLASAAQSQASDMAARDYWSTTTPDGQQAQAFIKQSGYNYKTSGENLAYGFTNSNAILVSWINSPNYKSNVLNTNFRDVGFGIAHAINYRNSGHQTIVVALYAQPVGTPTKSSGISPNTAVIGSTANANLLSQRIARIQLITGSNASWSLLIVSVLAIAGLAILVIRHGLFWRKALNRSEMFAIHHPWVDILLVVVVMTAFVLTRSAGNIL